MADKQINNISTNLIAEIRGLIIESRNQINTTVNASMSKLYWQIGKQINETVGGKSRTELYGKEVVLKLCTQLTQEYGTAFSEKNIWRMMQFANIFQDEEIVVSLIRQLSWTHLLAIIPIENTRPKTTRKKANIAIEIARNKFENKA